MSGPHKWSLTQRANFIATMRAKREAKTEALLEQRRNFIKSKHPSDKSQPEQIVYHGALYRRVHRIKVVK